MGFGGIGGLLRYKVDFAQIADALEGDDDEFMSDDVSPLELISVCSAHADLSFIVVGLHLKSASGIRSEPVSARCAEIVKMGWTGCPAQTGKTS